jgi:hypothetical protein
MAKTTKPGGGGGLASTSGPAPVGTQDVNLIEVLGVAVLTGGQAGSQGVGGLAPNAATAVGNPVQVGGVFRQNPAVLIDGQAGSMLLDTGGRPAIDIQRLDSQALQTTGVTGMMSVGGDVPDDTVESASYGVKLAAVGSQNPIASSLTADGRMANLITDMERFLRVVSRAFNPLTASDQVENQNLPPDDFSPSAEELANATNQAAARTNYPSDAGFELESRDLMGIVVGIRDGEFDIEVSNDATNWVIATKTLIDVNTGVSGWTAAGHYTEPNFATAHFAVTWSDRCEFRYIRLAFTPPNATNVFNAYAIFRAQ